jgi:protein phosphatase
MEAEQLKQSNLKILSFSEKGQRLNNEDQIYHKKLDGGGHLFLVADGMGGYEYGEEAAKTAINVIAKKICLIDLNNDENINVYFSEAHSEINLNFDNAGTTICGLLLNENKVHIFWTGDVKIFLVDDNGNYSNKEHTLLRLLQDSETVVKNEEIGRLRNTVTRAIGGKLNNHIPEHLHLNLSNNFSGIICTDGVHQMYSEEEMFRILNSDSDINILENIKEHAKLVSKDNYSAIFINNN